VSCCKQYGVPGAVPLCNSTAQGRPEPCAVGVVGLIVVAVVVVVYSVEHRPPCATNPLHVVYLDCLAVWCTAGVVWLQIRPVWRWLESVPRHEGACCALGLF
jgi:hypothetical protein